MTIRAPAVLKIGLYIGLKEGVGLNCTILHFAMCDPMNVRTTLYAVTTHVSAIKVDRKGFMRRYLILPPSLMWLECSV